MVDIFDILLKPDGIIAKHKSNYQYRETQYETIKQVYDILMKDAIMLYEGPCGSGKTYTYLIPLLIKLSETRYKFKAIIVTNSIVLQNQLLLKDLPELINILKEINPLLSLNPNLYFAIKGRANYICLNKYYKAKNTYVNLGILFNNHNLAAEFEEWVENNKYYSDITLMPLNISNELLNYFVCLNDDECEGKMCKYREQCNYRNAREAAKQSNIIITNYHYLLQALTTKAPMLPDYNILILDEAHELPDIAVDFLKQKFSIHSMNYLQSLLTQLNKIAMQSGNSELQIMHTNIVNRINLTYYITLMKEKFLQLQTKLFYKNTQQQFVIANYLFNHFDLIDDLISVYQEFYNQSSNLLNNVLDELQIKLKINDDDNISAFYQKIYAFYNKIEEYKQILLDFRSATNEKFVYWIENEQNGVSFNFQPVLPNDFLAEEIFGQDDLTCICMSATLSTNNNFQYIKQQLGIDKIQNKSIVEKIGTSPFNLTEQQLWYFPKIKNSPDSPNFPSELVTVIEEIICTTNGGALCLFTSMKNLSYVSNYFKTKRLPFLILTQNEMSKQRLIEKFKEDVDSVLFGSRSFFTGLDIPGEALRCVIIDKLPFPNISDPRMVALEQRLSNNFFKQYMLPRMIIDLKQIVGRGVRTSTDKCVICILDNRLLGASYKRAVSNSFNYQKQSTQDIEDVKNFLNKKN